MLEKYIRQVEAYLNCELTAEQRGFAAFNHSIGRTPSETGSELLIVAINSFQ